MGSALIVSSENGIVDLLALGALWHAAFAEHLLSLCPGRAGAALKGVPHLLEGIAILWRLGHLKGVVLHSLLEL